MKEIEIPIIIVDDEQHAIDLFTHVLGMFNNNLKIVGTAHNLPDALKLIEKLKPKAVFMDIEMPKYSGIQIADFITEQRDYEIIYVTAHSQYAIPAIKLPAFDYMLKPIDAEELNKCVQRLQEKLAKDKGNTNEFQNLALTSHQGTQYIPMDNILYIEASAMYSEVYTKNEKIIVSKPLGEIEPSLSQDFYRVHRSHIVNAAHIIKVSNAEGCDVILDIGKSIPVSRQRKDGFMEFMRMCNSYITKK
jgi:two-component system LytT family response regulator